LFVTLTHIKYELVSIYILTLYIAIEFGLYHLLNIKKSGM